MKKKKQKKLSATAWFRANSLKIAEYMVRYELSEWKKLKEKTNARTNAFPAVP